MMRVRIGIAACRQRSLKLCEDDVKDCLDTTPEAACEPSTLPWSFPWDEPPRRIPWLLPLQGELRVFHPNGRRPSARSVCRALRALERSGVSWDRTGVRCRRRIPFYVAVDDSPLRLGRWYRRWLPKPDEEALPELRDALRLIWRPPVSKA
jgi:hypothetical protein